MHLGGSRSQNELREPPDLYDLCTEHYYTIINNLIYQLFRETKKIISKIGNQRYFKVKPQPVGFTVIKKINYNQANETV